ncbi:hypothetical protein SAMN05216327_105255 [Dyadobacter sp. SG02]|uniref:hypothetical protein n=1 Tax=Dyadobacter sp. SG02 TaxID=1855291 RepID=UPI0008ABADB0|nr:hypothetical protein [Dyadobacter sp. SG02]SEJ00958.1 hypothetical protein SAMN05216327_105255 [Dyadobacter sp. SG02]
MARYLLLLVLFFVFSCKKDNDPAPDLTRDLVGVYQTTNSQEMIDKIIVTITVRWTIDKLSEKKIRLTHDEETLIEGEDWQDFIDSIPPRKVIFDNIELTEPNKFQVKQKIESTIDGILQSSDVEIKAELAGKHLDVNIKETFEGGSYQGDVLLKRQ